MDTREFNEIIAANSSWISALRTEVGKVVIGQQALVDRLILSLRQQDGVFVILFGRTHARKKYHRARFRSTLRCGTRWS